MNINFEYYKVFYYVVKYKKISIAAEKLFVSQPAVTQTIQKLEDQMGGKLLIRTKSGIELTEIGKKLFDLIKENIEMLDNAKNIVGKYEMLEEGTIKIRTGSNVAKLILCDAIEKFCKDYPNIKIEITTGAPNQTVELLHLGEIDMMLTYLPYKIEYSNLQTIECVKKKFVFAMSKKYYKNNNVKISDIRDLNNYFLILPKRDSAIGNIFYEKFKNKIINCNCEVTQELIKKEFILRDMGIGFINEDEIIKELESGDVVKVDINDAIIERSIGIITLDNTFATFATKKLVEYIRNN